jgi:hypothetical protein
MKGAVQGEAIATASTPDRKALSHRVLRLQRGDAAGQHGAELEHAGQVQRDQREQRRQRATTSRRLQLEAPAELLAGGAQRQHQPAQRQRRTATTPAV